MKGKITKAMAVLGLCVLGFSSTQQANAESSLQNPSNSQLEVQLKAVKATGAITEKTRYFTVETQIPVYNNGPNGENILVGYVLPDREYKIRRFSGDKLEWALINFGDKNAYIRTSQIIGSTGKNFTNHANTAKRIGGFLTNSKAAVYYRPDTKNSPIYAYLEKGVEYSVIGDYHNFYIIDVGGKVGYIHKDNLQEDSKTYTHFIPTKDLPVRYQSKDGDVRVGTLLKGQEYKINRFSDGTNFIVIDYGHQNAYIRTSDVTLTKGKDFKNSVTTKVGTKEVTIKSKAAAYKSADNKSENLFSYLEPNVKYQVLGEYYNYFLVNIGGRYGFVHRDNTDAPAKQEIQDPKTYTHFIPTKDLPVRYQSKDGDVRVGTLLKGQEYKITRFSDGTNFIVIDYGHQNAYIRTSDVTLTKGKDFKNGVTTKVGTKEVTIKSKAAAYKSGDNKSENILSYLEPNVKYQVLGKYYNYYLVNIGGRYGYVHEDNTSEKATGETNKGNTDIGIGGSTDEGTEQEKPEQEKPENNSGSNNSGNTGENNSPQFPPLNNPSGLPSGANLSDKEGDILHTYSYSRSLPGGGKITQVSAASSLVPTIVIEGQDNNGNDFMSQYTPARGVVEYYMFGAPPKFTDDDILILYEVGEAFGKAYKMN